MRRSVPVVALAALLLSACGGTTPVAEPAGEAAAEPAAPAADEPAPEEAAADEPAAASDTPPDDTSTDPDSATDDEPVADAPAGEEPPPEPAEEPAPEPEFPWPVDGCSADNSPTAVGAAEGPAPLVELRPAAANLLTNPLPDLAVRRVNCAGGWENLRNELPADRPLLVWFWAPH